MNVLVFDIETIPDTALGRRLHGLAGVSDADVAKAMFTLRRQDTGSEFLAPPQQRIVAISCVLRSREGLKVWSLGDADSPEEELIQRFFDGFELVDPGLVYVPVWRPDSPADVPRDLGQFGCLVGVGRKP